MKASTICLTLLLFFAGGFASNAKPARAVFQENRPGVCLVTFYQNIASDNRIGTFDKIKRQRIGIIVGEKGLVMVSSDVYPVSTDIISTANGSPLAGKPSEFKIRLDNGKEFPADFLGKDDQANVGFVQMKELPADTVLTRIRFSPEARLNVADTVHILELLPAEYQFEPLFSTYAIGAVIKTPRPKYLIKNNTTALSGGGLVLNRSGEAVGVTVKRTLDYSYMPPDDFDEFHKDFLEIIPANWFYTLIQSPPKMGKELTVKKSWLGIRMQALTDELSDYWGVGQIGGIIIDQVYPQSPAEKADLRKGDVILSVKGRQMKARKDDQVDELRTVVRSVQPGEKLSVVIFRNGKRIRKSVTLSAAPRSVSLAEKYQVPLLGFELRELTRDILYNQNLPLTTPGVLVFQVDQASPTGLAGLEAGDIIQEINQRPVQKLADARKIVEAALKNPERKIMVRVLENRTTRFVFINPKK